jgi:hypothetical protein
VAVRYDNALVAPKPAHLRIGVIFLALGYAGLAAASLGIVSREADPETAVGRHLWAGALANLALVVVELFVVLGPLRRGERWALLAAAVPAPLYGLPILILDATHVAPERLVATLAPQVGGLLVFALGLGFAASGIAAARR